MHGRSDSFLWNIVINMLQTKRYKVTGEQTNLVGGVVIFWLACSADGDRGRICWPRYFCVPVHSELFFHTIRSDKDQYIAEVGRKIDIIACYAQLLRVTPRSSFNTGGLISDKLKKKRASRSQFARRLFRNFCLVLRVIKTKLMLPLSAISIFIRLWSEERNLNFLCSTNITREIDLPVWHNLCLEDEFLARFSDNCHACFLNAV